MNIQSSDKRIPVVLHKFTPVEDWFSLMIEGRSLLFSSRRKFNDPFDCRPSFRIKAGKEQWSLINDELRRRKIAPAKRMMAIKNAMRIRSGLSTLTGTDEMLDKVGVLCLTPRWDNALMWSHYSDHHKGICVGFRGDSDIFRTANKVIYTDILPEVEVPTSATSELYEKVFLTKARYWEYEEEWRIIKSNLHAAERDKRFREYCCYTTVAEAQLLADEQGAKAYEFSKSAIDSVYLGMRISKAHEEYVKKSIRSANIDIKLYKIQPPSSTYSLTRILV